MMVFGRADGLPTCCSMPVWQLVHASPLCLPASWNSLTGAWQPKQPLASKLACFFAGVAAFAAGADCAYASGIVNASSAATRTAPRNIRFSIDPPLLGYLNLPAGYQRRYALSRTGASVIDCGQLLTPKGVE